MKVFDINDVFEIAISIEENGETFYRHAAEIADSEETKDLFSFLAEEEVEHKKTFKDLLSDIAAAGTPETYQGEYLEYIHAYTENAIFTKEKFEERISQITETMPAIDFAIQQESDSILYYHEIKKFVPEKKHNLIEKIITEERQHFLKLTNIKKQYENQ